MRKYILTIFIFGITISNTTAQQQCIITAPAAASSWVTGTNMPIQWNAGAFSSNVNLSLIDYSINYPNGQVVVTIATNVANTGNYNFLIPSLISSFTMIVPVYICIAFSLPDLNQFHAVL